MTEIEFHDSPTGSKRLYVFFSGLAIRFPPQLEFYQISSVMDDNKWFLLDNRNAWYQYGIEGLASGISATAKVLDERLQMAKMEKVCFVGISMGGFAALLFASLISSDCDILAIVPQTFISPELRKTHNDTRWEDIISKIHRQDYKDKVWDLTDVMSKVKTAGKIAVLVPEQYRIDNIHADHISKMPKVKIHRYHWPGHDIYTMFQRQNKWGEILQKMGDQ